VTRPPVVAPLTGSCMSRIRAAVGISIPTTGTAGRAALGVLPLGHHMDTIDGVLAPPAATWRGVVAFAGVLHATAFAYIMLFTRDWPDWTIGVFYKYALDSAT